MQNHVRRGLRVSLVACLAFLPMLLTPGTSPARAQAWNQLAQNPLTQAPPTQAPPGSGVVRGIRVAGTQRLDPQTVRSSPTIQEGDPRPAGALDEPLKALIAPGY